MQLNNWMAQQGAGNNVGEDVGENAAGQENIEIHPQWGEWPASPPPAPPALYNFQEWLANEGLQVQDGINLQDSPYAAWNDSISAFASSDSSAIVSDSYVLVPSNIFNNLVRGECSAAPESIVVSSPAPQHNALDIQISLSATGLQLAMSAQGTIIS